MTDTRCSYGIDRAQTLMSYLYDDIAAGERSTFESHLGGCARCREELDDLRAVRAQLTAWSPPQPVFKFTSRPASAVVPLNNVNNVDDGGRQSAGALRRTAWREIPVWAQVAAAMLVLGVSAAIANLNVHYGSDGLTVRTGWSTHVSNVPPVAQGFSPASVPWRSDLETLERQLRTEMRSSLAAVRPSPQLTASTAARDDQMIRRVRDMIAASERRQGREIALSVAAVVRDVNAGRAGDLARIEHTLGALQTSTGAELMKQRQQMVNYLTQVSLRR